MNPRERELTVLTSATADVPFAQPETQSMSTSMPEHGLEPIVLCRPSFDST